MLLSEGQMSDYKGAALMFEAIPKANLLIGDRGYDADWLRQALAARKMTACIPSKTNRRRRSRMTPRFTAGATRSRSCSDASKIGAASIRATIAAPTPSCPPSRSQPSLSSGSDQ
jgi:IS5 family transposase